MGSFFALLGVLASRHPWFGVAAVLGFAAAVALAIVPEPRAFDDR